MDRSVAIVPPVADSSGAYQVEEAAGITGVTPAATQAQDEPSEPVAQEPTPAEPAATQEPAPAEPAATQEPAPAEPAAQAPEAPAEAAPIAWNEELGQQAYLSNCMACHQATGQGIPGAFPPLAEHAAELYAADGGEYLLHVVLFGLQGQIAVNGMNYNGFMPAWPQLSDEQIASILNHIVTKLGTAPAGFVPYQPADIAAERSAGLTAVAVHEARGSLNLP
ncbi:MAG: cytochrome c [Trueperaceae bacterium]|nr:cytochrome c [Trueperaceae bacterium]